MKNVSTRDIDVNKLNSLGIYELRNLARMFGLARPTMLKREELIEQLKNQIICGDAVKNRSLRGRPPRNFAFDISKIIDEDGSFYAGIFEAETSHSVRSAGQIDDAHYVSGFIHLIPNKGYAVLIGMDLNAYHVPIKLISTYHLAMGDYIEAKVSYNDVRHSFEAHEISLINDIESSEYKTKNITTHFDSLEGRRPNEIIKLKNYEFKKGSRVLICVPNVFDRIEDIAGAKAENVYVIALLCDEIDDNAKYLLESGVSEVFTAKANFNLKKQIMLCLYSLFRAKQLAEQGQDVVLVSNLTKIFKIYNNSAWIDGKLTVSQVNLAPLSDLKTFFLSARALENGGSLSIISYINEPRSEMEEFLFNEFADLANVLIEKE